MGALEVLGARWRAVPERTRRAVLVALLGLVTVVAVAAFLRAASSGKPQVWPDSRVYLDIARQPFTPGHLFYPKPIVGPVLFRIAGGNQHSIAAMQRIVAALAWVGLMAALLTAVRSRKAQIAAVVVVLAFLFSRTRIGWTGVVLSESFDDSLRTAAIALGVVLSTWLGRPHGTRRTGIVAGIAGAFVIITAAWILIRDTNAIAACTAVVTACVLWRKVGGARWLKVAGVVIAAISVMALWSSTVVPEPPLGIKALRDAPTEVLARKTFPTVNNILLRVLPDPQARAFFVARGLPVSAALERFSGQWDATGSFYSDPMLAPTRHWICEHGSAVWVLWLLRHPLARADELAANIWSVFAPDVEGYLPTHWKAPAAWRWLGKLTTSQTLILLALLAAPLVLRAPRTSPLAGIAFVIVLSAIAAAGASYFGDAFEVGRHCYGAGQQLLLGVYIAVVAWLDRPAIAASA